VKGLRLQHFLEKSPAGGIHHVCYEVDDIIAARDHLKSEGARVLGDGEPKIGAHGKPVLFLHPKDFAALWLSWNRPDDCRFLTGFAVYFIIWWLVLFTVLPWGMRSAHEEGAEVEPAMTGPRLCASTCGASSLSQRSLRWCSTVSTTG
jgi:catechol 2,3-dioxygenase-like lactoylglutathione lyase family enzyme